MACNQACPVAEATVVQMLPSMLTKALSMPTEPKILTAWCMLSMSLMAEPHDYQLRQTASASA